MGIDVISWIGCSGQTESSENEWLGFMKLNAHRRAIEATHSGDRTTAMIRFIDQHRTMQEVPYGETASALDELAATAGECTECFQSNSSCYAEISFPIDEMGERFLFDYFLRGMGVPDSPADQIYRDFVVGENAPPWERRGAGADSTHESATPFSEMLDRYKGARVDSSQLMGALFNEVRGLPAVTAHALFWRGFAEHVPDVMRSRSRTLPELLSLRNVFDFTFRQGAAGSSSCDVLFFI